MMRMKGAGRHRRRSKSENRVGYAAGICTMLLQILQRARLPAKLRSTVNFLPHGHLTVMVAGREVGGRLAALPCGGRSDSIPTSLPGGAVAELSAGGDSSALKLPLASTSGSRSSEVASGVTAMIFAVACGLIARTLYLVSRTGRFSGQIFLLNTDAMAQRIMPGTANAAPKIMGIGASTHLFRKISPPIHPATEVTTPAQRMAFPNGASSKSNSGGMKRQFGQGAASALACSLRAKALAASVPSSRRLVAWGYGLRLEV